MRTAAARAYGCRACVRLPRVRTAAERATARAYAASVRTAAARAYGCRACVRLPSVRTAAACAYGCCVCVRLLRVRTAAGGSGSVLVLTSVISFLYLDIF